MTKYVNGALVLALAFMLAAPAQAQLLNANATAGGSVSADEGTSASSDQRATVRLNDDGTSTPVEDDSSEREIPVTDDGAMGGSPLELNVVRGDMDADTNYGVTESHEVRSAAGLESYAAASVRDDERLDAVAIAENRMDMTYRKPARFLGFIPGSVKTQIAVDANGEVTVDYPWYAFLFAKGESESELSARLASEIASMSDTSVEDTNVTSTTTATGSAGIVTGTDEVRRWANILDSIHAALSAEASANADAS